jgi:perosamine synthetase
VIPRKKLDIGWGDLTYALLQCLRPARPERIARRVEELWGPADATVATLSVRSGFDLLLSVLRLPHGTEILMSAVTIGDMARIAEAHGLVPVPVDMDMDRLEVDHSSLERLAGPAARVLLVAHLFGSRMPMEPLVRFASERGLLLLEDCAQAYTGNGYRGDPAADVSLFSFGPIKTNTALGGALVRFRDPGLARGVRAAQAELPLQPVRRYLARALKYLGIKAVLLRPAYGVFVRLCSLLDNSHDEIIARAVRSFAGGHLLTVIRQRPSAPLLALLDRRLRRHRDALISARIEDARRVLAAVPAAARVGAGVSAHTYWVVPVRVAAPERAVERLWALGIDGTRGTSSLCALPAPPDRPDAEPRRAKEALDEVLYLPCYRGMPRYALRRIRAGLASGGAASRGSARGARP